MQTSSHVIPAQARIQGFCRQEMHHSRYPNVKIPACAGMTRMRCFYLYDTHSAVEDVTKSSSREEGKNPGSQAHLQDHFAITIV